MNQDIQAAEHPLGRKEIKQILLVNQPFQPKAQLWSRWTRCVVPSVVFVGLISLWFPSIHSWLHWGWNNTGVTFHPAISSEEQVVRNYSLTVGARWMNLDGGYWRGIFVCNGETPCPTIFAEEGDIVNLNVHNDLFGQVSIHWSGMGHRTFGFWNDGTGGLNQYGLLQRGNFTSSYDTTGHWGLNWYADHTGVGIMDGAHGVAYIAPHPSRPRPYKMITSIATELKQIMLAERESQQMLIWNYYRRDAGWRVLELRSEGTNLNCYDSILVNSKGRRHCRHLDYDMLDGVPLDQSGCKIGAGNTGIPCTPTESDYKIYETHGRAYIMLNILNMGFEHAVRFNIDDHKMWVVGNDGGFIEPQEIDTLYITNGVAYTVLVKLDQEPADYAMRLASTSTNQILQGYSILRYPALRYPPHGAPMILPAPLSGNEPCLRPDGTVPSSCITTSAGSMHPYPAQAPPQKSNRTLNFEIGTQASKYEEHVSEFYLNQKPWQLYHAQMAPVLFLDDISAAQAPVVNNLPWGTTIDVIVVNTINETIPLYKHGDPTFLLGSNDKEAFPYKTVEDAIQNGLKLNMKNPAQALVHDIPPLGWGVIRWRVLVRGATMMHSNKFKYYALGMAVPLLEGLEQDFVDNEIPASVKNMPHVEFEPKNDGVFG